MKRTYIVWDSDEQSTGVAMFPEMVMFGKAIYRPSDEPTSMVMILCFEPVR